MLQQPGDASQACTLCGQEVEVTAGARAVSCPACAREHTVQRGQGSDGTPWVQLLAPPGEASPSKGWRGQGSAVLMLGFVGLALAGGFIFGARAVVSDHLLEPRCQEACRDLGLPYVGIAAHGPRPAGPSRWMSPDSCMCRLAEPQQEPSTCKRISSDNVACDAGFWFAGGRSLLSLGMDIGIGFMLLMPMVLWAVVRWRRGRH